jgi:hypothetical protein
LFQRGDDVALRPPLRRQHGLDCLR